MGLAYNERTMKAHYLVPMSTGSTPLCLEPNYYTLVDNWKSVTCKRCLKWKPKKEQATTKDSKETV